VRPDVYTFGISPLHPRVGIAANIALAVTTTVQRLSGVYGGNISGSATKRVIVGRVFLHQVTMDQYLGGRDSITGQEVFAILSPEEGIVVSNIHLQRYAMSWLIAAGSDKSPVLVLENVEFGGEL